MVFESYEQVKRNRRRTARRRFLFVAVAGVGGFFGYRWWMNRARPIPQRATQFVTSNRDFFTVSHDPGFRPRVDPSLWRLVVSGPGGRVLSLSLDDLRGLPSREVLRTLVCVGNPVGGTGMGNASWTVTPLAPLLRRVLASDGVRLWVAFYGQDGFYSSVPLEHAIDPETFLAYEMNREPLPARHGFPVRVLLPGKYGMKQPRWLERIVVSEEDVSGYWEKRGWSKTCDIRMTARIDSALPGPNGVRQVAGIAFCGAEAVGSVEVCSDSDGSWETASLTSETAANVWTTWEYAWKPAGPGTHILVARVISSSGKRQEESSSMSFPSGATGLHRVTVTV